MHKSKLRIPTLARGYWKQVTMISAHQLGPGAATPGLSVCKSLSVIYRGFLLLWKNQDVIDSG